MRLWLVRQSLPVLLSCRIWSQHQCQAFSCAQQGHWVVVGLPLGNWGKSIQDGERPLTPASNGGSSSSSSAHETICSVLISSRLKKYLLTLNGSPLSSPPLPGLLRCSTTFRIYTRDICERFLTKMSFFKRFLALMWWRKGVDVVGHASLCCRECHPVAPHPPLPRSSSSFCLCCADLAVCVCWLHSACVPCALMFCAFLGGVLSREDARWVCLYVLWAQLLSLASML